MGLEVKVERITKEKLHELIPDLIRLEHEWTGIGNTAWAPENFSRELPGKWEMSKYASVYGSVVGYHIASIDGKVGKLNKILVDSTFRNKGVGSRLWQEFLNDCRKYNLERAEFKVLKDNKDAINFYKKRGCLFNGKEVLGTDNLVRLQIIYPFKLSNMIQHSKPTISAEDSDAVAAAIQNGDLAKGDLVNEFVCAFSKYIGKKYGVATCNGTAALHLALRALDIKKNDNIIMPSYVCNSVFMAVDYCNANPVFVDINPDDYNISFKDTKSKIKKVKAMILPHMFGKPIKDLESFLGLSIPVVEDCALSIGASYKGKKVGSFGDLSIFSFRATKMMTTGLGGMVLTDDKSLADRLTFLMNYDGREEPGESYNYSMSDFQAALGISQLSKLDDFVKRRREIADNYTKFFDGADVDFVFPKNEADNIFFRYIIRHNDPDGFIEKLSKRGVYAARPVFIPLHSYLKVLDKTLPNTAAAYNTAVSIPIYPSLSDKDVDNIAGIILNLKYEN